MAELAHLADMRSGLSIHRGRGHNRALQGIGNLTHYVYPQQDRGLELVATLGEMLGSRNHRSRAALDHFKTNLAPRLAAHGAPGARALVSSVGRQFRARGFLHKSAELPDLPAPGLIGARNGREGRD